MAKEKRTIRFKGNVQGVGFRYNTVRAAGGYDVTGYVKNLPDGTVECVAEGEAKEIDAFVDEVTQRMGQHIRDTSQQSGEATGRYDSFGIRY
jgi:acylphosphatase